MVRMNEDNEQKDGPVYVEREVNLTLINQKLNQALELLYRLAEKNKVQVDDLD